jgi:hypothetical protein
MYRIYAIENDLRHLLVMNGTWVVNGHYHCALNEDGSLTINGTSARNADGTRIRPFRDLRAYYVMDFTPPKGRGHYNDIAEDVRRIFTEQGRLS